MAHFAKVENGLVTEVIVAEKDFIDSGAIGEPSLWIQTSYNTRGGIYYEPNSDVPSPDQSKALRGNYAGIGYVYDSVNDIFYAIQPYPSWTLNTTTWTWDSPIPYPSDDGIYNWNEYAQEWVKVGSKE